MKEIGFEGALNQEINLNRKVILLTYTHLANDRFKKLIKINIANKILNK